jgi:RTX calcium-binding nonapeptide repeat (4 copies)
VCYITENILNKANMANVNLNSAFDMSILSSIDADDPQAYITDESETGFTMLSPTFGRAVVITGKNFNYGEIDSSVVTGVNFYQNGIGLISLADLWGSYHGFSDQGYSGYTGLKAEMAYWLRHNDVITGSSSSDTLCGYAGHDTLFGGPGSDTIDGGDGNDVAVYSLSRSSYTVTASGSGYYISESGDSSVLTDGADYLTGIESVEFSDGTFAIESLLQSNGYALSGAESYLLGNFGVSISDAYKFVLQNLDSPKVIFDACKQFGVTSSMLAEIFQAAAPGITATGVEQFFKSNGLAGSSLESRSLNIEDQASNLATYGDRIEYQMDAKNGSFDLGIDFKKLANMGKDSIQVALQNWGADDSISFGSVPVNGRDIYNDGWPVPWLPKDSLAANFNLQSSVGNISPGGGEFVYSPDRSWWDGSEYANTYFISVSISSGLIKSNGWGVGDKSMNLTIVVYTDDQEKLYKSPQNIDEIYSQWPVDQIGGVSVEAIGVDMMWRFEGFGGYHY